MQWRENRVMRGLSLMAASAMLVPTLAGCGGGDQQATNNPPPIDMSQSRQAPPPAVGSQAPKTGMSTRKKVVLLAGAAALYYMYNKKKNAQGQTTQYYRSETNGRIYYRDPKNPKQAIYVTPPREGIEVPIEEAQNYSGYRGYNRQNTGQQFGGYGYDPSGNYAPAN